MKIICVDEEEAIAISRLLTVVCNELGNSPVIDPDVYDSYEQSLLLMRESITVGKEDD